MKKIILSAAAMLLSVYCMAQEQLSFPFQGGKDIMFRFFKDNLAASPEMIKQKATGTITVKFTADDKGGILKIIVYYADDAVLVPPVVAALKKSDHKWIIPDHEKLNDFIITFLFKFNPAIQSGPLQNAIYTYATHHIPIVTSNEVPLDQATLLPVVTVIYDIK